MRDQTAAEPASPYPVCLRFFAQLKQRGVRDVVISPGSRSTPLAIAAHTAGLATTMQIDERVGSFHALGLAKANRRPVVLVCTSGTAGANYHPAVIEAHHAGVPLIVCTADRPSELRQWGAGQTIDQLHLFGSSVRWFFDMPVASEVDGRHGATAAIRAFEMATNGGGPVHLNWPFREPLEPPGALVAPKLGAPGPIHVRRSEPSRVLADLAEQYSDGLIVVGPEDLEASVRSEIISFGRRYGWPIVADPASGLRSHLSNADDDDGIVTTAELLFGSAGFEPSLPVCDVVVRVGLAPTSKAYRVWLEQHRPAHLVLVAPGADWGDPTASVTNVVSGPLAGCFAFTGPEEDDDDHQQRESVWSELWRHADVAAGVAAESFLSGDRGELGFINRLVSRLVEGGNATMTPVNLVVSNSMPIRELDFAMRVTTAPVRVFANRGANGIDGIAATAAGVAAGTAGEAAHTYVLLGDVATVHDLGGLAAIGRQGQSNITVVVIDNDAGAIFSMLPVAGVVEPDTFTRLFSTPHGTDIAAVGAALGFDVHVLSTEDIVDVTPSTAGRPRLIVVQSTVDAMTSGVAGLRRAVAAAFER
jgi:2-succinyl-5-enolpyruvyl-6-hydroxy-3-cyclohexene-1-carboxylate synthase